MNEIAKSTETDLSETAPVECNTSKVKPLSKANIKQTTESATCLNCVYSNVQSFISKKSEIQNYLKHHDVDLVLLTETWMTQTHGESEFHLEGYQKPVTTFNNRGGTSFYVKNGIKFYEPVIPNRFTESSCLVINTDQNISRIYMCVYRSPNSTDTENQKLIQNLKWAKENFRELVIVGDFNLPNVDWVSETSSDRYQREFLQCVSDCDMEQIVNEPTRHREGQVSSLLDLILVNNPEFISSISHEAPFGKSDHEILSFKILNGHTRNESTKEKFNFKKINSEGFRSRLRALPWRHILHSNDEMTSAYTELSVSVKRYIEETVPLYTAKENIKAPWSSRRIEKLARKKRKCWGRYKHSNFDKSSPQYTSYQNALKNFNDAKFIAVRNYESKIISNKSRNQKKYYAYLSKRSKYRDTSLLLKDSDGIDQSETRQCTQILNQCYSRVFTKGKSKRVPEIRTTRVHEDMPAVTFTEDKVKKKLENLNVTKATGPDGVPASLLRNHADLFAPILTAFFNRSYIEGSVPDELKTANISPIFKGGDKKLPENYRPVSITPIIAKIFESIIYDDLSEHIEKHKVINKLQHGFQKCKSTTTNLLEFWDQVTKIADKSQSLSIIYTDLKKAFDTVPHDLLLAKLEHYGVRNETLKWIASFLDNRKQRVVVDGVASDYCSVESGVPQGGTLSGLFFIIYMNDLPPHLKSTSVSMYADDAKIFAPVTEEQSISNIQQDINVLSDWCIQWRLQLNPRKCFFLHFTPRNTNKIFVPIYQ